MELMMPREEWQDNWKRTIEYIDLLETRIIELGGEVKQLEKEKTEQEKNKRLTALWARGEIEN